MVDIRRSTLIDAPVEELWAILRDFNGHVRWHPAVETSLIESGEASDQIGAVRNFRLKDGSRIREQLLFLSDAKRSFGYCILEAPAPLRNYVASVRLRPVTSENACLWEWRASFDPPPSHRERLVRFVRGPPRPVQSMAWTASRLC
jgi:NADPH:quinone reductase